MRFEAIATDFDGTLAYRGVVDDETVAALQRARVSGQRLLLVTGRELSDLLNTFHHSHLFDVIVAENGAVLYVPATQQVRVIAEAPPASLLERLTKEQVPVSVGHSIIATMEPYEHQVLAAIHDLGLEWHVIFNKGAVMALPADVTKATGLLAALEALEIAPKRVVGIGDAENDQSLLRACGMAVAVANALPSVKEIADLVTQGERGAGVAEVIDRLRVELSPLPGTE